MSHGRRISVEAKQTLAETLTELEGMGVSTAAIVQDEKVIGYLAVRMNQAGDRTPERDARELEEELRLAKEIQQQLLPRSIPVIPGLKVYGILCSARDVGGDYWSAKYYRADNRVTLKLADVTGHGIAAALLVPAVKYISGGFYRGATSAAWVMERTNHVLTIETPVEIMVSMVYAWYSPPTRQLTVVNAGHKPAFIIRGSQVIDVPPTGPVLGLMESQFQSVEHHLEVDDIFFACSDGITEALVGDSRFGEDRVKEVVLACRKMEPAEIADALLRECSAAGGRPHDDRSILVAKGSRDK